VAIGTPDLVEGQPPNVGWRSVDSGYFAALRIPLLHGRVFGHDHVANKRNVFVLSQQAALSLYSARNPVGCQRSSENGVF
jgi:hypothetical protein